MSLTHRTIAHLPTLAEMQQTRRATPKASIATKLDAKVAKLKQQAKDQAAFVAAVWARDKVCVYCGCHVVKSLELKPNRGEVHHCSGRRVKPEDRFNVNRAVLLCSRCHQRVTRHEITVEAPTVKA